jgi:Plasmid encoded RepA protein
MAKTKDLTRIDKLITTSIAIQDVDAYDADELGFMARAMVMASLPHSRVEGTEFERSNGDYTLSIVAPSRVGLPYGTIPRLLLCWLTTEAVRTKERELVLGDSLSGFMRQLDLVPTGGRWGSITRLRNQTERLFASSVTAIYRDRQRTRIENRAVIDSADLWWHPKEPNQGSLWQSTVTLSEPFFREIVDRPVPIDMRALRGLKKSPMALDVYVWLTYRMSYLTKPTEISWHSLQGQFGAGYPTTPQGIRHFRQKFLAAMKRVQLVYNGGRATPTDGGMKLLPGRPHVRKLK